MRLRIAALAVVAITAGCAQDPRTSMATETVTAQPPPSGTPIPAGPPAPGTSARTTNEGSRTFSVSNPGSPFPGLRPGLWVGQYLGPTRGMPPAAACHALQWSGSNRADIIGVWGTPVGETALQFPIVDVRGFIELSGNCDWSGGDPE